MGVSRPAKVVVAGAGLMGRGIAHAFAAAGYRTVLTDISADALGDATAAVGQILDSGVSLGKLAVDGAAAAMERLTATTDLAAAADGATLMVETVSENLATKIAVLTAAQPHLADDCLIASNSSALSVTEIARATARPARVIGMHFFNPVHKMKLVELVRGLETADDAVAEARTHVAAIGKTAILVSDSPGLTTSRMSAMLGNEAMFMLMEGTASAEDIDTAHRMGFNHPLGPLELGDVTGWDTRLAVLQYLHRTLGEKYRPCPLIIKMVAAGRHGRKTGAGVYDYRDGVRVPGSGIRASVL